MSRRSKDDGTFLEPGRVRGRVVGVERSQSFPDANGKRAAWLSGSRWQLGQNQWASTAVYLAPTNAVDSSVQRCVHVDGDLAGAVRPGNVVEAQVHAQRGRLVADRMVNVTTNAEVPVGEGMLPGVSPAVFAVGGAVLLALVLLLVWAAASGELLAWVVGAVQTVFVVVVDAVVYAAAQMLPYVLPIVFFVLMLRFIFTRR